MSKMDHERSNRFVDGMVDPFRKSLANLAETVESLNRRRIAAEAVAIYQSYEAEGASKKTRIDDLTKLLRRRAFEEESLEILASDRPIHSTVIFFDIDRFKSFNDKFGHDVGDEVLQRVAQALQEKFKHANAKVGRWGGEEMVVFLPGFTAEEALKEFGNDAKFNVKIESSKAAGQEFLITVSGGIANVEGTIERDLTAAINKADAAMYFKKMNGRDGVVIYNQDMETFFEDAKKQDVKFKNIADVARKMAREYKQQKAPGKMQGNLNLMAEITERGLKELGKDADSEEARSYYYDVFGLGLMEK